jgi:hypothetical protein
MAENDDQREEGNPEEGTGGDPGGVLVAPCKTQTTGYVTPENG